MKEFLLWFFVKSSPSIGFLVFMAFFIAGPEKVRKLWKDYCCGFRRFVLWLSAVGICKLKTPTLNIKGQNTTDWGLYKGAGLWILWVSYPSLSQIPQREVPYRVWINHSNEELQNDSWRFEKDETQLGRYIFVEAGAPELGATEIPSSKGQGGSHWT